ncbi:hypothetical protein BD626DRAFT_184993 [Schizophyllum amplum]|uniref:Uncharacterized protein n=1 Tax=Schizophyllum amplum TaxID=97359 RepID=A0A550C0Q6_9AGAR|nr:hypothetical protein BD626DRAFT_184993 [Auriculariopsis ampla]
MSWPWSWLDVASGAVQALAQAPLAGGEFDAPLGSVFDDRIYRLLEKADLIFARRAEREATCQPLILLPAPAEADATISADLSKVLVNVVNAPSSFDWLPYIIMILLSLSACTLLIKLVVFNVRTQHASVQPLGAIYVEDAMPTLNKTDPSFIAILSSTDISTTQEDIDTADSSVTVDTSITVNDSIDAKNNLHVKDQTLAREAQTPTPPPSPMNSHGMKLDDDSSVVNVEPEVDDPAASHENAADSVPVIVRGTRDPVQDVPEPVQDMPNLSVQDMPAPVQDVPEPVQDMPEMALATAAAIDALSFDADLDRDSECDDNSSFDMSGSSADDASGSSADDASGSSANDASSSSADGSFSVEDSMSVDEDDDPTGLSLDVALDPSPQVASSPSSDVAASPSSHVAASPSSDLAPSPSSDVAPSPSSHVAPSPFVDIAPIISPDNDTPSPQDPTPFQASVSAVTDTAAPAEGAMEHTKTSAEDDDAQDIKNIEDGHKDADNHDNNDDDDHFEDRGDGGNENGTNGNNDDPGDSSDGEDKKDDIEGNGDESEDATDTDTDTEDTENVDEAEPCSNMDVPTVAAEVNAIDVALDNTTFLEISESADTAAAPDEGATDDTMPSAEDDEAHVTRNKYTEKENPTTLGVKLESTTDDVSAPDQADTLEESLDDIPISEASEGAVLESAAPAEDVGKQTTASSEDDEAQVTSIDDAVKNDQVMDDLIDDAPAAVNDGSPDDVEASVHPGAVEDEDEESLGDEGEEVGVDPKVFKEEREPLNELDAHDGADDSDLQGSDMGVSATVAPATLTAKDLRDTILADTTEPPQRTNETYPECSGDQDTSRAADGESTPDIDLASKDADTTSTRHEVAAALAETKLDSEPPNSTEGVVDPAALQHELAQYIGRLNKALKRTVKMADEAYILDGDEAHDVIAGLLVTDIIPERAQELLDAMPRIEAFYFDKVRWVFADEDKWWSEALLTANKAADPRNPRPTASKAALNQSALGVAAKATTSEETTDPVVASTTTSVTPLTVSSSLSTDSSSSPMPSSALDTQSARDALHHQIVAYIGGLNGAVRFLVDKDYKNVSSLQTTCILSLPACSSTSSRCPGHRSSWTTCRASRLPTLARMSKSIRRLLVGEAAVSYKQGAVLSTVPTRSAKPLQLRDTPSPSPAPAPLTSASETVSTSIAPPPRPRTIDEVREGLVAKFNELDRAFKVVLDCKNDIPTEYHVVVADKLIEALGPSEAEKLLTTRTNCTRSTLCRVGRSTRAHRLVGWLRLSIRPRLRHDSYLFGMRHLRRVLRVGPVYRTKPHPWAPLGLRPPHRRPNMRPRRT